MILPTTARETRCWYNYHLVQPYYFAHHHFHRRKVLALREAGLKAWILALVPEAQFIAHQARYEEALSSGYIKILRIPAGKTSEQILQVFLLRQILFGAKVLIHVLREDPSAIIRMRQWPIVGRRIRYLLEYEGDMPTELVYESSFVEGQRPPETPPPSLRGVYERLLNQQLAHARAADGMVLMSREMQALWGVRLGRPVRACILPTLADGARIYYDEEARWQIRTSLGIQNQTVLVYAGNTICKWQRLEAMCQFASDLAQRDFNIWFLALVRADDVEMTQKAVERFDLAARSTVMHVPESEMYRYLSAADAALFLRHDHLMNRVVTSGKLGKYLAAGLPVITTGANTEMLNDFIREADAGVFISDSLALDDCFQERLRGLLIQSRSSTWRVELSRMTGERFSGKNDAIHTYVSFVKETLTAPAFTTTRMSRSAPEPPNGGNEPTSAPLAFFGDICGTGGIPADSFLDLHRVLPDKSILVGNVECCISDRGSRVAPKYACLRESPEKCQGLSALDVAILANNHISDFGEEAASDTVKHLEAMGVQTQGYGEHLQAACSPCVIERDNKKVGIISYSCPTTNGWNAATAITPGVAPLVMEYVEKQIRELSAEVDGLFVYLHWGVERSHYPTPDQIRSARQMIDWGADAIIGVHAHVIQAYERYGNGFIFYGLGNAVFNDVATRSWNQDGTEKNAILQQQPHNQESLVPVFQVQGGTETRVKLENIFALRYKSGKTRVVGIQGLSRNMEDINWRFHIFTRVRHRRLRARGEIKVELLHRGGYYYCDYAEPSIDQDPFWNKYDRLDQISGGRFERLLKRIMPVRKILD